MLRKWYTVSLFLCYNADMNLTNRNLWRIKLMNNKRIIIGVTIGITAAILWSVVFINVLNSMAGIGIGVCLGISAGRSAAGTGRSDHSGIHRGLHRPCCLRHPPAPHWPWRWLHFGCSAIAPFLLWAKNCPPPRKNPRFCLTNPMVSVYI